MKVCELGTGKSRNDITAAEKMPNSTFQARYMSELSQQMEEQKARKAAEEEAQVGWISIKFSSWELRVETGGRGRVPPFLSIMVLILAR